MGSDDDPLFGPRDPELDLGPRRKKGVEKSTVSLHGTQPGPRIEPKSPEAVDTLELESVPPNAPALELESIPAPAAEAAPSTRDTPVAPEPEEERKTVSAIFEVLPPMPTDRLSNKEVDAVAEYGSPPGFVGAIPYVIHVYPRWKELNTEAEDARGYRKTSEAALEGSLSALGQAVVVGADGSVEALTEDVAGVQAAVKLLGETDDVDSESSRRARRALALLARRALAADVATAANADLTRRVARAEEELGHRRRRERVLRAAADSYDKPTVYQGVGVLGGAALVVLIFVLFVLARAIF